MELEGSQTKPAAFLISVCVCVCAVYTTVLCGNPNIEFNQMFIFSVRETKVALSYEELDATT